MAHPKLGRCPNQKWMRTLTTQESPDFSHGECQFLKELSKILPDKDFQKADSIIKENLKEKKNNNREKYIESEDLDADL